MSDWICTVDLESLASFLAAKVHQTNWQKVCFVSEKSQDSSAVF